jgi:hypothetical protein
MVAYLDGEIMPSESVLMQAHVATCDTCQKELAALAAMGNRIGPVLKHEAAGAVPSPRAWSRLEARLATEARSSPSRHPTWLRRLLLSAGHIVTHIFAGGLKVRRGFALATVAAVLSLSIAGVFALRQATPVSAQQVLERSYAVQVADNGSQSIQHIRSEVYRNWQAGVGSNPALEPESKTIEESYLDPQTGRQRHIITDAASGRIVSVFALDGTYVYNSRSQASGGALEVYRSKQPGAAQVLKSDISKNPLPDSQRMFEEARTNPNVQLVGQEKWFDGRQVDVLRFKPQTKGNVNDKQPAAQLNGLVSTLYFDSTTYQLVENRQTVQRDGKDVVVGYDRVLLREALPKTTAVAWDLSDFPNITVTDDPDSKYTDRFMEPVAPKELAARGSSAYVLKTVPEGFEMQLSAPAKPATGEEHMFMVEYRNQSGDYIVMQGGGTVPKNIGDTADELKTASGLRLRSLSGRISQEADKGFRYVVEAPDGSTFTLSSNLPRERVKTLAEELVPLK